MSTSLDSTLNQLSPEVSLLGYIAIIALMMEAVRTSETSVNFNVTTRRYIPEDTKLHTRRHENLKSHTHLSPVHTRTPCFFNPLKPKLAQMLFKEFSPYVKENTTLHHYILQLVNDV
jgi:hypothetical protein